MEAQAAQMEVVDMEDPIKALAPTVQEVLHMAQVVEDLQIMEVAHRADGANQEEDLQTMEVAHQADGDNQEEDLQIMDLSMARAD